MGACFTTADKMNYDILIFNIAVFIAAIFLLDYGADKFIDHTAIVASRLGVSQTLVALLTAGAEWEEVCKALTLVPLSTIHRILACGGDRSGRSAPVAVSSWECHRICYL